MQKIFQNRDIAPLTHPIVNSSTSFVWPVGIILCKVLAFHPVTGIFVYSRQMLLQRVENEKGSNHRWIHYRQR